MLVIKRSLTQVRQSCLAHRAQPNRIFFPFHDETIDDIFRMKKQPQPWSKIRERLQLNDDQAKVFEQFVAEEPAPPYQPYIGNGVRWHYFGHACILVENETTSFLFDPVLSYTYEAGISRFTYDDLPDHIDYVVITHRAGLAEHREIHQRPPRAHAW